MKHFELKFLVLLACAVLSMRLLHSESFAYTPPGSDAFTSGSPGGYSSGTPTPYNSARSTTYYNSAGSPSTNVIRPDGKSGKAADTQRCIDNKRSGAKTWADPYQSTDPYDYCTDSASVKDFGKDGKWGYNNTTKKSCIDPDEAKYRNGVQCPGSDTSSSGSRGANGASSGSLSSGSTYWSSGTPR